MDSTDTASSETNIGLLRHGETEWNVEKKIQGSEDSPLTTAGKNMVSEWAMTLQQWNWDRIYASDLGRVRQTVEILNKTLRCTVQYDKRLREQKWGEWEGLTISQIKKQFTEDLDRRVALGWEFKAPGGETRSAVRQRVFNALKEIAANHPDENILIVCHQGVIKSVLYHITGRAFLPGEDPLLRHNCFHRITCSRDSFSPLELNIPRTLSR